MTISEVFETVLPIVAPPAVFVSMWVVRRKMLGAIELLDDCTGVIEQVRARRALPVKPDRPCAPCVLQGAKKLSELNQLGRVLVADGQDSFLLVDPYGSTDLVLPRDGQRFRVFRDPWGLIQVSANGVPPDSNSVLSERVVMAFRRKDARSLGLY